MIKALRDYSEAQRLCFWSKVDRSAGPLFCWPWLGAIIARWGYGVVRLSNPREMRRAHRVAWELTNGPIPDGMVLCHTCDFRACCNPAHLFVGTQKENMADAVAKGRMPRGEKQYRAKLTEADVREIRRSYEAGEETFRTLSDRYGISPPSVYRVVSRITWAHVD